uniref:Uncharacterized protein n=1 Tax=Rhizophora mucronata TaxID=61149 RepID=A0A2P2QPN0_RHIMU
MSAAPFLAMLLSCCSRTGECIFLWFLCRKIRVLLLEFSELKNK